MNVGSLKRPLEIAEGSVLVSRPAKMIKLSGQGKLVKLSREEMAFRDWRVFATLAVEDRGLFMASLQWQRVLNMGMHIEPHFIKNGTLEYSFVCAELQKRGIDAPRMCWSWDKPIPLLPGFFPENFPPFYSFSTDMTVEEEISAVQQICAEKRSGKDASGDDAPAKQMVAPSTSISLDSLLHLRSDIRSDRERLLMDMAASRLFSLSFSVESSVGSSRYDLVTDAILWSVDFTFHLDTSVGPKQETFVVDDTSERDVLRPHINTVIVFNDIPDSITIEFEKAGRRSENAINVFFVTPHVAGINAEAGYTLINQDDTLLDVIRGKHVIDRPRFLIVLKSQSMKFLRKAPNATIPSSTFLQPQFPVADQFGMPNPNIAPCSQAMFSAQPFPSEYGVAPSPMGFGPPQPGAQFAGSSCGPPMYSFAMHGGPPATLPPFQGMPMQPVPDMSPAGCIAQPSVQLPRSNLVVLTSKSQSAARPIATKVVSATTSGPSAKACTSAVTSSQQASTDLEMRSVTAKKGTGSSYTPEQMAEHDIAKIMSYSWTIQKKIILSFPLKRALNLFYYLRHTRRTMQQNNVMSLLPNRLQTFGVAKLPVSWKLTDRLPMMLGYKPLTGIIPINQFEIDDAADDENFEKIAMSADPQYAAHKKTSIVPEAAVATESPLPIPPKPTANSSPRSTSAPSAQPSKAATSSSSKEKQMLELSHSEMAYWDYDMVGAASDFKEALDKMSFTRLVNLAFHLKRFPPRRNTNFTKKLKKYLFSSLDAQGVIFSARWKLDQPIPKKPRCMKVFPRVEEVFHVEHFPNYKENRTWDEIANPSEPVFPESEKPKGGTPEPITSFAATIVSRRKGIPTLLRDVNMWLKKSNQKGIDTYISGGSTIGQELDCQCSYDARTDLILWSVQMKLEAFKDGVFEEGIFHIHKVYDFDSLQSILRNFVFDVASRRHSLADEFKPTIRDDGMKFIEMFMVTPILKEDKIVMLRRASVDYTLSLANAIKSTVVVDCPRFIARCKIGFDESVVEKEFADVDPPIPVLKCKEEEETPKTDAPKETSPEPKRLDILPHMETLLAKEVAFTLTPTQVAASDLEVLKGQPWDDQKFLVSVMPWDRVAALILYLRSANNDDHLKNLLILCELRLEKVGIGPIPEDWLTTHKVPTLPGYSPSMFPPFLTFGMAEVPLNAKSMFDVKNIAEELAALKDSTKLELPRLLIRFEPRNHVEQRLLSETTSRQIHFAFSMIPLEENDKTRFDITSRSILWSVDVVFSAKTDGKSEERSAVLHGVSERSSLCEVVRQAVQEFTGEDKVIDLFRPETTEDDMRSVDVLFAVPRIESAKFDVERYQRLKLSHSLMESLRDKVVINKPKFLIVLKEHSSVFSTKLMRANEEKALVEFYGSQRQLTQPKSTGAQFLGLFDAVHENLLRELISLREMECNTSVKSKKKAVPQPIRTQEPHLQSAPPTELPIPTSLHYGPKKILPIREMTFTEKKNIEDMVSMATHRNMEDVLKPVHSIRAVSFLSHLANFWGRIIKEDITVGTTSTRMVVFIEGLPRLITLGQSENDTVVSATVGAYSGVVAALCYMLVVPFEMWTVVAKATSDEWTDTILYACRQRFSHLLSLSRSDEFSKLTEFRDDFDSASITEYSPLWKRFIHKMRSAGIEYWRKNHDIQIPAGVAGPDLSSYPGTYFRFSEVDAPVDWAVMNAAQVCSPGPDDVLCDELPAPARYAEQEYEVGLLPPKTRNPDAQRCPVTAAENWYETIVVLPEDPLIQITARDCETRGDKTGTRFQSALNHRLIDEVSRRFKWKVVLTHRVQWESNSQFTNWFHLVDVKFENIARFYFHGHGKHISFRRAVEIAESFIMSNFCRMGIVPLEMYDLIRNFGEDWIDPVLYACRECFAAFERFARNSTFAELNSLTGAQLFMANPSAPVPILFPKAYEFARCIRDFCLRFWSEHQLVTVPKSIKIPKAELTSQFFMFEQVEGAELWDEFFSSAKDVGQYDKQKLLPVTAKLPPWEKCSDRKRKLSTPLMFDEACEEFRSNDLQEAKVKSIRQFVESLAGNIASKILIHEQKCNGEYHFEIRFSGEVGEFLHGKATATKEKAAYATAIRELYVALLNCAFVLPCMDEFLMRPYPSNIDPDEILWSRIPFITRTIRPLLQRFRVVVRRYHVLLAGVSESSRSDCDEQLMSLVRRRNEETWRTHPVAIPLYLFFDDEDSEICRNTLQPFVQVLDPNTIWVGDVKELRSNEGEKKATLYPESSSLSIEDLAAEKITVRLNKQVVAKDAKTSSNGTSSSSEKNLNGTGSVKVENTVPPAVPVVTDGKKQLQMDCGAVEPLAGDQQLVIPLPWEAGIEKCQGEASIGVLTGCVTRVCFSLPMFSCEERALST
ncbi:hypothetical protein Q1695_003433 [Nippostrongylus brasiliensis]|nr:hypothetical protein Q1695_003433 [Nippostrongylus brasiliensis]